MSDSKHEWRITLSADADLSLLKLLRTLGFRSDEDISRLIKQAIRDRILTECGRLVNSQFEVRSAELVFDDAFVLQIEKLLDEVKIDPSALLSNQGVGHE